MALGLVKKDQTNSFILYTFATLVLYHFLGNGESK
jgi:hypothetical protein